MTEEKHLDFRGPRARESKDLGEAVVRSDEMEQRRKQLTNLIEELKKPLPMGIANTPEEVVKAIESKIDMTVGIMREALVPFGRAGTRETFGKLAFYFEKLVGMTKSDLSLLRQITRTKNGKEIMPYKKGWFIVRKHGKPHYKKGEIPQSFLQNGELNTRWDIVEKAARYFDKAYFAYFLSIAHFCWLDEDVSKAYTIVVKQPPNYARRGGEGLNTIPQPGEEY